MKLRISDELALPIEAVTQTFADLAKRGAGKTYLASVLAEEMLKAGQPIVALDPTGAWWGLRSGFPIAVLGGEHADVPLQETAGEVIAQAIVENRFSAVIDLSLFRKGQMIRFMVSFLETLYRLNREPLHLFVDEADAFAPQGRTYGGGEENRMLGAMEDLVRRGRKRGIGCTLITQRPAVLNKNVLTQCESVFALRMVHPRDIGALEEWINVHADPVQAKEVIASLPSLPVGEAWFWSPGWMGTLKRIKVRKRETFDSSATPKPGETIKTPKSLASLDLAALGKQIQATVQSAKENDPRELKRRIAELERQLKERPKETKVETKVERVEVPVLKNGQLDKANRLVERMQKLMNDAREIYSPLANAIARADNAQAARPVAPAAAPRPVAAVAPSRPILRPVPKESSNGDTGELTGPEHRILNALAWMESIGVMGPEQSAVAFLAGYTVGGGAWNNPKGRLRGKGLVEYLGGDCLMLTDAGRELAERPDSPLTTAELHRAVMDRLPGPEQRLLRPLLEAYPNDLSNEELAQAAGYEAKGGAFNNPRGRLRSLGLVEYRQGRVAARSILFLE